MTLDLDKFAYLCALEKTDPSVAAMLDRLFVEDYKSFIRVLYNDIDSVITSLQNRKQVYCSAGEDEITMHVVDLLNSYGYNALHDPKQGGHVDIYVTGRNPAFQWLGEAKLDNGSGWLEKGFHQLCRRYSTGGLDHDHGGILVYVQGKNANHKMVNWKQHLLTLDKVYEELSIRDCNPVRPLIFETVHNHDTTGLPYTVRHFFVGLYHDPIV